MIHRALVFAAAIGMAVFSSGSLTADENRATDITAEVSSNVDQLISQAEALGWTEIGGVRLSELKERKKSIYSQVHPKKLNMRIDGRTSAHYSILQAGSVVHKNDGSTYVSKEDQRWISFNPQTRSEAPPAYLPYLDTHETTGAALPGKEEQNYEMTVRLKRIVEEKIPRSSTDPRYAYLSRSSWMSRSLSLPRGSFEMAEGGNVKVGGGGDWEEIALKERVLKRSEQWIRDNIWNDKNSQKLGLAEKFDSSRFQSYLLGMWLRIGRFERPYEVHPYGNADPERILSDRYEINIDRNFWHGLDENQKDKYANQVIEDAFIQYVEDQSRVLKIASRNPVVIRSGRVPNGADCLR